MKKNKLMHTMAVLVFVLLAFSQGYSQDRKEQIPSIGKVFDRFGKERNLTDLMINTPNAALRRSPLVTCSTTSYFNLYFEDGSGMEDVTNPVHNARRNVACKVFETLSSFINSPLTANGKKVNIHVRNMANSDAPAGTLGMASSYYIAAAGDIATGGILDGEIWKTIHLGVDSYTNTGNPGLFYHGEIAFNFGDSNIQWHTDLATTAPSTLYDLYTVMLHEVVHSLGFNSFIDQNGASITGLGYYTRYDTFLKTNASNLPLLSIGSCKMYDVGFNSSVSASVLRPGCTAPDFLGTGSLNNTLCNDAIKFVGTSSVPVYTPTCFEPGSSLSHFEDQLYPSCTSPLGNDAYFVVSNSIGKGVTKRFLRSEERNTLCDLGYSVKTAFGSSSNGVAGGFVNYGGMVCGGITVAGVNDGINANGSYAFIGSISTAGGTSTTVTLSGFLSNDVNATGFECLQDITAAATLSATAGTAGTTVSFTTTVPGHHMLRYVPINGTQRGNITYVHVYIIPPPSADACSPVPVACNLVMNGDFEQFSQLPNNIDQITRACGWDSPNPIANYRASYLNVNATSDFPEFYAGIPCNKMGGQTCKDNIGNGYAFITIGQNGFEHLFTRLQSPLEPNTTYQLSFDASLAENYSLRACNLQAYLSNSPLPLAGNGVDMAIPNPANLLVSPTVTTNLTGWDTINFTFTTTTGGEEYLYLGLLSNYLLAIDNPQAADAPGCPLTTNYQAGGYYIDNVVLIPTNGAALELPTAMCTTQRLNDLRVYLSDVAENGVFSGPGVTLANGVYSFTPAAAGIATIAYTFTSSSGCLTTLYDTVNVTTGSANSITANAVNDNFSAVPVNGITGGATTSVYANDTYNGAVSTPASLPDVSFALVAPISISGASINAAGVITVPPNTPGGTYTLTYSLRVIGNCSFSDTATVTIVVQNNTPAAPGADGPVYATLVQPNGFIIIAGNFHNYNGVPRNRIARLKPDLTLDTSFDPNNVGFNDVVFALAFQGTNIIVGGRFTATGTGQAKKNLARLTSSGIIDNTFANNNFQYTGTVPNGLSYVKTLALDSSGRILVGGLFGNVNSYPGTAKNNIVRLQTNGNLDNTFSSILLVDSGVVNAIEVLSDQTILIGGQYLRLQSGPVILYKVIPSTGALEPNFTLGKCYASPTNTYITTMSVKDIEQKNGKLLVAGYYNSYNLTGQNNLVQISTAGVPDGPSVFNPGASSDEAILSVVADPVTSRIIIGGEFSSYNGNAASRIARLLPSGGFDGSFVIGSGFSYPASSLNNSVYCLRITPNGSAPGKILVGGYFAEFNGAVANFITRLVQSSPVVQGRTQQPGKNNGADIKIYPNPSEGIFTIDLTGYEEQVFEMTIHNTLGQLIYKGTLAPENTNQIDLTGFESGSYFVTLQSGAETVNKIIFKK